MEQSMYGVSVSTLRRYEFRKGPETINFDEIVRELAQLPVRWPQMCEPGIYLFEAGGKKPEVPRHWPDTRREFSLPGPPD